MLLDKRVIFREGEEGAGRRGRVTQILTSGGMEPRDVSNISDNYYIEEEKRRHFCHDRHNLNVIIILLGQSE